MWPFKTKKKKLELLQERIDGLEALLNDRAQYLQAAQKASATHLSDTMKLQVDYLQNLVTQLELNLKECLGIERYQKTPTQKQVLKEGGMLADIINLTKQVRHRINALERTRM